MLGFVRDSEKIVCDLRRVVYTDTGPPRMSFRTYGYIHREIGSSRQEVYANALFTGESKKIPSLQLFRFCRL